MWRPVVTLLVLAPAIGELLSGSSPPLQFFNPIAFLLLVGLYGCGALLVRETVARYQLNASALLLLGAAYGILEEGITCKSFFNPHWTDTGFLSVYGRLWGVNWVWTFGLTIYHMVVSVIVPVFLTEALFSKYASVPWLKRRGWIFAGSSLSLVALLGFWGFDNRQFHLIEIKEPRVLADKLDRPIRPLDAYISQQLSPKNREAIHKAISSESSSADLKHALQDELNRLLVRADLYSADRFHEVSLPSALQEGTRRVPQGDKLVTFNRALLECAYPGALNSRTVYPFRPPWWWSLGSVIFIAGLIYLSIRQRSIPARIAGHRRPCLSGLGFTVIFALLGFLVPGLVEHGAKFPATIDCALWVIVVFAIGRALRKMDACPDQVWQRGLWAIGVITPWVVFGLILGIFVGISGAKSFAGMSLVALTFGLGVLSLALKWRRRLEVFPSPPVRPESSSESLG
jgi:hypothetical protein